nr:hypothetical protein [Tanacetum cinerariifolium]
NGHPSKDQWSPFKRYPEFTDDTITDYSRPSPNVESTSRDGQNQISSASKNGEPTDSILSKHAVKFVKAVDRPEERPTTNKAETVKKPTVKYAEMYRRPSKKHTGKPTKLEQSEVPTARKRVQRETTRSQNHAYKSPSHRSYGAHMRPSHRPAGHRPLCPPMRLMRSNMNGVRPKRTSAVRPQYRAPWVPTVNRNFPL